MYILELQGRTESDTIESNIIESDIDDKKCREYFLSSYIKIDVIYQRGMIGE